MTFPEIAMLRRGNGERTDQALMFDFAAGASLRVAERWHLSSQLGLNLFGAHVIARASVAPSFGLRPFIGVRYMVLPISVCVDDSAECPLEAASDSAVSGGAGFGPAAEVGISFAIRGRKKGTLLLSASYMAAHLTGRTEENTEVPFSGLYDGLVFSLGMINGQ